MKTLLLALTLTASLASAETITLGYDANCTNKQCKVIPNDANPAVQVDIYGAPGYPWFYVYLTEDGPDGAPLTTMYYASQASGTGFENVQAQSFTWADPFNPANKIFTGKLITVSGAYTSYVTHSGSGRGGGYAVTHWQFTGGSVVR